MSPMALLLLSSLLGACGIAVVMSSGSSVFGLDTVPLGMGLSDLAVIERTPRDHALFVLLAGGVGFASVPVVMALGHVVGVVSLSLALPSVFAVIGGVVGAAFAIRATRDRVREARMALRHQLTAYVDMVTMLVAGDNGHEAALEHAAAVGEGLLFAELRRSLREQSTRGGSLVGGLDAVAEQLGLDELRQISSAVTLAGAEGAPVVRSLSARASSLRSALAGEQELEARLRTSRLTGPIVGMALVFMVLVVYPALSISPV
jgi:tight adherence protein C